MASSVRMLAGIAAAAVLFRCALAATSTVVGAPNGGWDLSTDLQTWAASQKFTAGDTLVFRYDSTHTVLEVTQADYDACGTGNPIGIYTDGNTAITLENPGKRYFICGVPGHCPGGMKLEVDVAGAAASAPPPPSVAPPTPAATPPSAPEIITPPPTPATPPPVSSASNAAPELSPFPSITPPPAPAPPTAGTKSPPPPSAVTPAQAPSAAGATSPPSPIAVTPAQAPSAAGAKSPPSPGSHVAPEPTASGQPSGSPPPTAAGKVPRAAPAPSPSAAKTLELSAAAGILCMLLMRLVL